MRIRPARPSEAARLSELAMRSKASWGYSPEFLEACREELSVSPEYLAERRGFVLEEGERVVGFYTLEETSPEIVELGHLFVEPAELRRGCGRALLAHAVEGARQRGFRILRIQGDPNAEPFYRSCGARQAGVLESASIPGRMLPLFELALQPRERP